MAHRFGESTGPAWMAKRVRLSLVAVLLGLLAVSVGLALSGNWLVSAQSNDFDAEAEDIWTLGIVTGQTADISARFQNLSPSTGPHGGEATFDVTIYVEPPTGTATRFSWDNEVFTLDQRRTFSRSYTFASAGTYTVLAEIYDINGQQSGWNADNRFDQLTETFTVREPVTVQISPSSYTVSEGDGEVEITVSISQSPSFRLSVGLRTLELSARQVYDYGRAGPAARFEANTATLTQTIPVPITNDRAIEGTESFQVEIASHYGDRSVIVSASRATVTILDDDETTVAFERNTIRARENSRVEIGVRFPTVGFCPVQSPFDVHFSYTDPDGALSSSSTIPSSMTFRECDSRRVFLADLADVTGNAEVVFTLDSVTSVVSGVASRVKIGEPSTVTLTVIDDDSPPPASNRAPTVSPVPPSASSITLETGDQRTFEATASDPDDNLTKWKWDVDKHLSLRHGHQEPEEIFTATGSITKSFSHTFPDDGTYTVTVTFTDSEGLAGAAEWTVKVFDGSVSLICGVEPIDSRSSALVGGQLVRTFAEVTAREDLTNI